MSSDTESSRSASEPASPDNRQDDIKSSLLEPYDADELDDDWLAVLQEAAPPDQKLEAFDEEDVDDDEVSHKVHPDNGRTLLEKYTEILQRLDGIFEHHEFEIFFTNTSSRPKVSDRRKFTRDLYDYCRGAGMTRDAANAAIKIIRTTFIGSRVSNKAIDSTKVLEDEDDSDNSAWGDEIDDNVVIMKDVIGNITKQSGASSKSSLFASTQNSEKKRKASFGPGDARRKLKKSKTKEDQRRSPLAQKSAEAKKRPMTVSPGKADPLKLFRKREKNRRKRETKKAKKAEADQTPGPSPRAEEVLPSIEEPEKPLKPVKKRPNTKSKKLSPPINAAEHLGSSMQDPSPVEKPTELSNLNPLSHEVYHPVEKSKKSKKSKKNIQSSNEEPGRVDDARPATEENTVLTRNGQDTDISAVSQSQTGVKADQKDEQLVDPNDAVERPKRRGKRSEASLEQMEAGESDFQAPMIHQSPIHPRSSIELNAESSLSTPPQTPKKNTLLSANKDICPSDTDSTLSPVPSDVSSILSDPELTLWPPSPPSPIDIKTIKKPRTKRPTKSPYFPKDNNKNNTPTKSPHRKPSTSCLPFPPLSAPRFGLMQETLSPTPFRLLLATIFLNRTRGTTALPTLFRLLQTYPTIPSLATAPLLAITEIIHHLGFQNQRAKKCIALAQTWLTTPPEKGRRYKRLNYPCKGDGRDIKKDEILADGDERVAWEVAHLPGIGAYGLDSWRIFCRDERRHVGDGWVGEDGQEPEPEWKRVIPLDKELRAYLTWRWLREGWIWNRETGEKIRADEATMERARRGGNVVVEREGGEWDLVVGGEEVVQQDVVVGEDVERGG